MHIAFMIRAPVYVRQNGKFSAKRWINIAAWIYIYLQTRNIYLRRFSLITWHLSSSLLHRALPFQVKCSMRCLFSCHSLTGWKAKNWWFSIFPHRIAERQHSVNTHINQLYRQLFLCSLFALKLLSTRSYRYSYWRKQISIKDVFVTRVFLTISSFTRGKDFLSAFLDDGNVNVKNSFENGLIGRHEDLLIELMSRTLIKAFSHSTVTKASEIAT